MQVKSTYIVHISSKNEQAELLGIATGFYTLYETFSGKWFIDFGHLKNIDTKTKDKLLNS